MPTTTPASDETTGALIVPADFQEWATFLPPRARQQLSIHDLRQIWEPMRALQDRLDEAEKKDEAADNELRRCGIEITNLEQERDKLAEFKAYVHKRLDDAGVPVDPESPHKAAGCRIGGRLDVLFAERDKYKAEAGAYQKLAECGCGDMPVYPAHGWLPGLCPNCQAGIIENDEQA